MSKNIIATCAVAAALLPFAPHVIDLIFTPSARTSQSSWTPTLGPPPVELTVPLIMSRGSKIATTGTAFKCYVRRESIAKNLILNWLDLSTGQSFDQILSIAYFPTSVNGGGRELEFFVGGKNGGGRTIIEVMKAQYPTISQFTDPVTGQVTYLPAFRPLLNVNRIFSKKSEEQDMVQAIARHQGDLDVLCVKFHTTGSVYNFPFNSFGITPPGGGGAGSLALTPILVAYANLAPGVFPGQAIRVPELTKFHPAMVRHHHPLNGYVMCLQKENAEGSLIILSDPNKDLKFDSSLEVLTAHDWELAGFGYGTAFLPIDWPQ